MLCVRTGTEITAIHFEGEEYSITRVVGVCVVGDVDYSKKRRGDIIQRDLVYRNINILYKRKPHRPILASSTRSAPSLDSPVSRRTSRDHQ